MHKRVAAEAWVRLLGYRTTFVKSWEVWHYGPRKSLAEWHVRHVGAGTCRHRNEGTTFVKSRGSAEVEPFYRHVDAGSTRGTEVQVLQAR